VNPVLDARSSALAAVLADPAASRAAALYAFGVPVYYADASTPRVSVVVDREPSWGTNDLSRQLVPIPVGAQPQTGSDGKLVIVDVAQRKVFDLWQAKLVTGTWHASWGGVYPLTGSGSSQNPTYVGPYAVPWPQPVSRGTGSGLSSYAGVVRLREISAGVINHALVFGTDRACGPAQTGPFRFPATTTDGNKVGVDCLPEGTRVQLDPSINVNAIAGITPAEKAIARALQTYGAYVIDNAGARMSIVFEKPKAGEANPYPAAGLAWDYYNMPKIPWSGLRVLRNWQGT
jgi:hypothetical protein